VEGLLYHCTLRDLCVAELNDVLCPCTGIAEK
jgi:hypothetical protein